MKWGVDEFGQMRSEPERPWEGPATDPLDHLIHIRRLPASVRFSVTFDVPGVPILSTGPGGYTLDEAKRFARRLKGELLTADDVRRLSEPPRWDQRAPLFLRMLRRPLCWIGLHSYGFTWRGRVHENFRICAFCGKALH